MCKRIKDILWPLNVLGKKVRSIPYKLPDGGDITLNVTWDGDRLQLLYTAISKDINTRKKKITPVRITEIDGDPMTADITRGYVGHTWYAVGSDVDTDAAYNVIYFKCTNVTSLVINGETII